MLAITISCSLKRPTTPRHRHPRRWCRRFLAVPKTGCCLVALLLLTGNIVAQTPSSEQAARQIYKAAQSHFATRPTSATAAWELGRAAYDLADLLQDDQKRNDVAQAGIEACRHAV